MLGIFGKAVKPGRKLCVRDGAYIAIIEVNIAMAIQDIHLFQDA
jgi:hypothetical protein